jgi:predicted nucleic acid-binding protein
MNKPACFVDSNIWLYALMGTPADPKSIAAKTLLNQISPVISLQVIQEVCANLVKRKKAKRSLILQVISSFESDCLILIPTILTLKLAEELRDQYHSSFWDSLILATAVESKVPILYTEDLQHQMIIRQQLTIINPFSID